MDKHIDGSAKQITIARMLSAAVLATVFVYSGPTYAQAANFKCAAPGTIVEYSDGQKAKSLSREGNFCRIQQTRADRTEVMLNWFAPTAALVTTRDQGWVEQVKPSTIWPLMVGKKISARYDGPPLNDDFQSGRSYLENITVEKSEKITVAAGTFETVVLALNEDAIGGSWRSTLRQWYAPDPGVVVKYEYSDSQRQKETGEALSIRR